jgi:hypothetical protein
MSIPDTARHSASQIVFEDYPVLGYNYRLTDIRRPSAASRWIVCLRSSDIERELAARYMTALDDHPFLQLPVNLTMYVPIGRVFQSVCALIVP